VKNSPIKFGDNPDDPRDPDRNDATDPAQNETRLRFIPSGLANEVFLDTFERVASFEPSVPLPQAAVRRLREGGCTRGPETVMA